MFVLRHPQASCAIEQGTKNVPNDGSFYVLLNGERVGRFRTLGAARAMYAKLTALAPKRPRESLTVGELMRLDMNRVSNKELIWQPEDFARVDRKTRRYSKHGGGRP